MRHCQEQVQALENGHRDKIKTLKDEFQLEMQQVHDQHQNELEQAQQQIRLAMERALGHEPCSTESSVPTAMSVAKHMCHSSAAIGFPLFSCVLVTVLNAFNR